MTLTTKLILYGVLAALLSYGVYQIKTAFSERAELKVKLKAAELSRDTAIAGGIQYQQNNERQVKLISDYQSKLEARQNANSNDERDANAGVKRVYVKASCPSSPATANSPAIKANAELDPIARGNYFRLKSGLITLEENYALCLRILDEDRSAARSSLTASP